MNVFPTLWARLQELIDSGRIEVPYMVAAEIEKKNDTLHNWIKENESSIAQLCKVQEDYMREIMATYGFLVKPTDSYTAADPFVIALARKLNAPKPIGPGDVEVTVLSDESQVPEKRRIPYVCDQYGIRYVNVRQFFEREQMTF
jgi:hypothetical protein